MSRSIETFSYQCNVSSSKQESLRIPKSLLLLCVFSEDSLWAHIQTLAFSPKSPCGDKSLAFESVCEFWKPSPTLAPGDTWPRLSMLALDLNVMGLKNYKTGYLASFEDKLEGNPPIPPSHPNLVK